MTNQPDTVTADLDLEVVGADPSVSRATAPADRPKWRPGSHQSGLDDRVEFAEVGDQIAVRDPDRPDAPALLFSRGDFHDFCGRPAPDTVDLRTAE